MSHLPRPLLSWFHAQQLRVILPTHPLQLPKMEQTGVDGHLQQTRDSARPDTDTSSPHDFDPPWKVSLLPSRSPLLSIPVADLPDHIQTIWPDVLRRKDDLRTGDALQKMTGKAMEIHLKSDAKPYALHTDQSDRRPK